MAARRALARRAFSFTASPSVNSALETTTLATGSTVASLPYSGPVVSMGVSADVGSRKETAETSGVSSLIAKAKLLEYKASIEALGGTLSTLVTRETTTYTATVLKESAGKAAEVLVKCAMSPPSATAFGEATCAASAEVAAATYDALIMEELHSCAFLDTQMGAPVSGTTASVSGLTSAAAATFFASTAGPLKGVAVGAGAELAAALKAAPAAGSAAVVPAAEPAIFTGSDKKIVFESYPEATIALAYEFPTLDSEFAAACMLMPEILGMLCPGESSIDPINLHAKMARDLAEQGISTSTPFYIPYKDTALFGFKVTCKDTKVDDAMWYSMNNLVRLCYDVTEVEMVRAKIAFKSKMAAACASPEGACATVLAPFSALGVALSPGEICAQVDAVALDDVKKTAYKFIHDNDHALAACGPLHELPDYNWVRSASYNYHY